MLAHWTQVSDRCPLGYLFIYPTGRIRVCKMRFVSTGENRGNIVWYARKIFDNAEAICSYERLMKLHVVKLYDYNQASLKLRCCRC